jgi:hypothetical protein
MYAWKFHRREKICYTVSYRGDTGIYGVPENLFLVDGKNKTNNIV